MDSIYIIRYNIEGAEFVESALTDAIKANIDKISERIARNPVSIENNSLLNYIHGIRNKVQNSDKDKVVEFSRLLRSTTEGLVLQILAVWLNVFG
tara:strand:+ start:753 stop:1037 length:285 start_codon:yes stop_codon:yes gene_type:complete